MASATVQPASRPWQQRRSVRGCYVLILLVLAGCAFADSFAALAALAQATGALPGHRAVTLPLMLDGLTLAGTLFAVTRFGPGQGSPAYGYALIAVGSLASLAGNVAHAPATGPARVIAGAPPLILFAVFEAAAISFRRRPTPVLAGPEPVGQPASDGIPSAPGGDEPVVSGPERATGGPAPAVVPARLRAERVWAEHAAAGQPLSGARLAELVPRQSSVAG